jgi:lipopolysaccharide transport system permease protein
MIQERVIRPKSGMMPLDFQEVWRYRELFIFLVWRDVLVRYKQTLIGVAWAVVQPVVTMVVFTVIFGELGRFPSKDAPYAVMTFAAVLPWQFFATALSQGSNSIVNASNMIRKVYFPRLILPASSTMSGMVDFSISFLILFALMSWYKIQFRSHLFFLPLFFMLCFATAIGANLWLSALNTKYRDVRHVVPFLVRIGIYISPVGFMSSVIPDKWRLWYHLNPMVGVIDGFRWVILGPAFKPHWLGMGVGMMVVVIILTTGAYYFRSVEKTFADVI